MKNERWDMEIAAGIRPERKHFEWLEHEKRFHSDPVTQNIIGEIIAMLQPERFVAMKEALARAQEAIHEFQEATDALVDREIHWRRLKP